MSKCKDLTGMRFGYLTVQSRAPNKITPNGTIKSMWNCICDCGNTVCVQGNSLTSGRTISCGCFQKQCISKVGKQNKKYNTYDLSGEYGVGYTSKGEVFYFDLEDYEKIKDYCWYASYDKKLSNNGYYIKTNIGSTTLKMHRLVMNATDPNKEIDHINRKPWDNRKKNLRITTRSINVFNRSLQKNNASGKTGVCFDNTHRRWVAYITHNGKRKILGYFIDKNDAINARVNAEKQLFNQSIV